jgi:hypothetical protein
VIIRKSYVLYWLQFILREVKSRAKKASIDLVIFTERGHLVYQDTEGGTI